MEFLIFLVIAAFLFTVFGVIGLLGKTGSLTHRVDILEMRCGSIKPLEDKVRFLEELIAGLQGASNPSETAPATLPQDVAPLSEPPAAEETVQETAVPEVTAPTATAVEEGPAAIAEPIPEPPKMPHKYAAPSLRSEPREPSALQKSITAFIKGGNLWAAGGIVLLIVAFALLITYLALRGFFTVEMGIAAAAASGLVMLAAGWRFRQKRPTFFLLLQGGGIGILYLSVFAAHKLTPYFPPVIPIILLSVFIPSAIVLAIFQKSQPLAFFGFLGGFAAPLLITLGAESHVFLFAYYGVLSLGVLAVGFFRCWRALNLLSFLCTFAAAFVWLNTSYEAPLFWSAEPFFIGYILLFTALGLLGFRTGKKEGRPAFDGILVLGTPLVGAVLQWEIFAPIPHGLALASIAFSTYYLIVTLIVLKCRRNETAENKAMDYFAEGYLALSALMANLAIPLELAPQITSAIWAAEGVLIFLLGRRQGRIRVTAAGLVVHIAAAVAFAVEGSFPGAAVFRSPRFIGSLLIAFSALAIFIIAKKTKKEGDPPVFSLLTPLWAYGWWFGAWIYESYRTDHLFIGFLVVALSALAIFIIVKAIKKDSISPVFSFLTPFWAYGWWFAAWIYISYRMDHFFVGFMVLALTTFAISIIREKTKKEGASPAFSLPIALWAFGWWFAAWIYEGDKFFSGGWFLFLICSATALGSLGLSKKFRSLPLRVGTLPLLGFATVRALWMLIETGIDNLSARSGLVSFFSYNFFAGPWIWAWLAFILVSACILFFSRRDTPASLHGAYLFTAVLVLVGVFSASGRALGASWKLGPSWISFAGLLPLFASMLGISVLAKSPVIKGYGDRKNTHITLMFFVLPLTLSIILGAWFMVTLFLSGDPAPLPLYIPLVNPLDLQEGFCIVLFILWQRSLTKNPCLPSMRKSGLIVTADIAGFFFLTAIIARSVHFYGSVPYHRIPASEVFHLCLFILWALYGIGHIIYGSKSLARGFWLAGAALIVADIAKLLILDMADSGAIPRIASFFIAGLVLLFIGWVAPLPPAKDKGAQP